MHDSRHLQKKFKQLNSPAFHRLINQILKNTVIWPLDIKGHLRSFQTFFFLWKQKKDIWYLFALISTKNKFFLAKICTYGKRYHKYISRNDSIQKLELFAWWNYISKCSLFLGIWKLRWKRILPQSSNVFLKSLSDTKTYTLGFGRFDS